MIWFKTPDGQMVNADTLPLTEANLFITTEADEGMVVRCFRGDAETMSHLISLAIPHLALREFLAQVKTCAEGMGVDWASVPVREIPEPPTSPIQ